MRGWLLSDGAPEPKGSLGCATPSPSPVSQGSDDRDASFSPVVGAGRPGGRAVDAKHAADDDDATVEVGAKGEASDPKPRAPKPRGLVQVGGAAAAAATTTTANAAFVEDAVAYASKRVIEVKASPSKVKTYDLDDDGDSDDDAFGLLGADAKIDDDGAPSPERNKVFVSRG